jgi:hypothetical protein
MVKSFFFCVGGEGTEGKKKKENLDLSQSCCFYSDFIGTQNSVNCIPC